MKKNKKMSIGKKVGIGIAGLVSLFLVYVASQSPDYVITREITIHAPAEKIFPYLNNSKLAEQWGPWLELDPQTKMTYTGPDEGVGSRSSWDGGKQLGTGSATIVESIPNQKVKMKIEYVKPMEMVQDSEYMVQASGDQSVVTWRVQGKNSFAGRMMSVFVNMDKVVGGMFEKGLSNLKNLVEKK